MSNPIKYSTGTESLALKKGNFYIGTGDVGKGPTSSTGYYNGISPPSGGYTIYLNKETGGPSIYTASNDAQLISLTNSIAGQSYTTVNECLVYFVGQTDKLCVNRDYEGIVTDGLILNLDAGFTPSYPKNGTTWYDISKTNNGTLTNGPTFSTDGGGSIVFDGTNDNVKINSSSLNMGNKSFTGEVWIRIPNSSSSERMIFEYNTWPNLGTYQLTLITNQTIRVNWPETFVQNKYLDYVYTPITQNVWTQVVGQFDTDLNVINLYINGSLVSQITGAVYEIGNVNSTMHVMSRGGNTLFLPGNLSIFRLYNRALTADEVLQNFNAQKGRFGL
jgi:hypothetical protein